MPAFVNRLSKMFSPFLVPDALFIHCTAQSLASASNCLLYFLKLGVSCQPLTSRGPEDVPWRIRGISGTLETQPDCFFYLSNGVTAIAHAIEPRGPQPGGGRR